MSLRVIDAASHQGDLNQSAMDFDALIVKATEGCTYVNPYCDGEFQEAFKLGKKLGVYHFARNANGNTPEAEAQFFIEHTRGYIGKAIPVLDWEDKDTSNVAWALKWLQEVEKAYGCKPILYTSESVVNAYDWSAVAAGDYGLWCAKYRDDIPDYNWDMAGAGPAPSIKWWKSMALWQWTSVGRLDGHNGNLDCSIFYGDEAAWDKYVGAENKTSNAPKQEPGERAYKENRINYRVHQQTYGWLDPVGDGQVAGITNQKKRVEAIKIDCKLSGVKIHAKGHIQGIGWKDYGVITSDTVIGTTGQEKRLEAISLEAEGLSEGMDIYVRYHIEKEGWSEWIKGGTVAGTVGFAKRLEAIQIKIQ